MSRTVSLVVVDGGGHVLGALPAFEVTLPYWQEVADVVAGAWEHHGATVEILRLLETERPAPHGGAVTYLAQTDSAPPGLLAVDPHLALLATTEEPLRAAYARPGGPAATLAWARAELGSGFVAEQQRTWNLSAIWRLRRGETTVWLKQVPEFFAHEPDVLAWAGRAVPGAVPTVLAAGADGRMLLEHVPGEDLYDAAVDVRARIAVTEHEIQRRSVDAVDHLLDCGVPDHRGVRLAHWLRELLAEPIAGHPAEALLDSLEDRLTAAASCGLPDALVHGDAHPGNAIGTAHGTVLIDWGDSFLGHPAFDALRMCVGLDAASESALLDAWAGLWRASVPGCDPRRAVELVRPVECLRLAAVYANFLERIEPAERVFHAHDVGLSLDQAVESTRRAAHG